MTAPERVSLNLTEVTNARRRGCVALGVAALFGAALGGLVGLLANQTAALITAAVVIVLMTALFWVSGRRRLWLEGDEVVSKAVARKKVDLRHAERIELLVTDIRGTRTIGLLVGAKNKTINLSLAVYAGTGGRELGILILRRLADILAGSDNTSGLIFSQLLVAQLRAEAKGEAAADRPLYRLASLAPTGRLAQRLKPEAITRFVASLD
ncbi:hypothetical protein BLA60_00330 [Actinophytocola xinjiangensis]|uniref:Uncharacterized protein n=1 Tax=Actinophytocola xinjiangensis TaxID=485602 RepID=A0A7Z1B0K2_9PSEU|nr:hypothetical protein [Actinophytocola xinjiangensis]OLF13690.1 hypothetical protein BLA60_00330 [Actinophytocola xinjiangensis]